jgi:hypothetical protein
MPALQVNSGTVKHDESRLRSDSFGTGLWIVVFDAFSSREPVSTPHQVRGRLSLESALVIGRSSAHLLLFLIAAAYDERIRVWAMRRTNAARHNNGPSTERMAKGAYPAKYLILPSCGYLRKSLAKA